MSPEPSWLPSLLACPHCRGRLLGEKEARCLACGRIYPRQGAFLDLRAGRERSLLKGINASPLIPLLYDTWRIRSTGLLSGGRLSFSQEIDQLRAWLLPTGGPFLDVGTGTGVYREALGERAVGLDPSPAFLRMAQKKRPGIYLLGHGEALPFRDGAFAGVAIGPTWNEFLDPGKAAAEARRVLRPGGRLFGLLLLGPGPSLGLWRPQEEEVLTLLEGVGLRTRLERQGRLGLLLAQVE